MKSMLYVGASLMIGASIYGLVDYRQNQEKQEFREMYKEVNYIAPGPDVAVIEEKNETVPVADVKTTVKETKTKRTNPVKAEKEPEIVAIPDKEKITPEPIYISDMETEIDTKPEVTLKKKKRLNHKIFSRAPLREELEIEKTSEEPKEGPRKDKS